MKKHFSLLFSRTYRWFTIGFFLIGVLLMGIASWVTIADNPPGIALFYSSIVFFFLSLIHVWRKPSSYFILSGVGAAIILLIFVGIQIYAAIYVPVPRTTQPTETENIVEGILFTLILFISIPALVIGLVGGIVAAIAGSRKKPSPAESGDQNLK
jgi:hypothetical protein